MLEVGRITKAHGLKGEVLVELFTNRQERLAPGAELQASSGNVLVVRRATPHQNRWIVVFEGVTNRDAADALRGVVLSAEPIDDPDALWVHELVGAELRDLDDNVVGTVSGVLANPAGDILETSDGILVPLRFVTEHGPGFVRVDAPEGLFDVNK